MTDLMAEYGEFAEVASLLPTLMRLRAHGLDADATFILPEKVLPGVTSAYGLAVVRAAVPLPMIGLPGQP